MTTEQGTQVLTKVCTKCGNEWTLESFSPHSGAPDGLRYECKPCVNEYVKAWQAERRKADPEGWKTNRRESVRRHRERTGNATGKAYSRARSVAIRRLIESHREEFQCFLAEALEEAPGVRPPKQ